MTTHSSILAQRIPQTGAWLATVQGVAESRIRLSMRAYTQGDLTKQTQSYVIPSQGEFGQDLLLDSEPEERGEGDVMSLS